MGEAARRPFANGTERYGWQERNCDRCWKQTAPDGMRFRCAIEGAIVRAADMDVPVPSVIVDRLGWTPDRLHLPKCPERESHRPATAMRRGRRVGSAQITMGGNDG